MDDNGALNTTAPFHKLAEITTPVIGAAKEEVKMPYNSKAFGIVIGRLRMKKGLTQEKMSGLAGIARSHLVALENGKKTVKLSTLWNIAYALDLKPSELIRLVEQEAEE